MVFQLGGWVKGYQFLAIKKRTWYESLHSASDLDFLERPRQRKMNMRFRTWNVRSFYREDSLITVARELELLVVCSGSKRGQMEQKWQ
jgi:hypothetical protein